MRRSFAELEMAEQLARAPRERGEVLRARAQMLQVWGFVWDGFEQLRFAQFADPERPELAAEADAYMRLMERPDLARREPAR
jgi:hypothetical protein